MLVALPGLGGGTVYAEPANVTFLEAVPAALLPSGTTDGTYVNDAGGNRIAAEGTPADVAALLSAGLASAAVGAVSRGFVDGATGAVTMISGVAVTGVRDGVGRYTCTIDAGTVIEAPSLTLTPTSDVIPSQNGPIGATFGVAMDDGAGAPADEGFVFHIFGTIQG